MLSRKDIEKEIGKAINIVPLNLSKIKENSINLTIGQNAWTKGESDVYWAGGTKFSIHKPDNVKKIWKLRAGEKCVVEVNSEKQKKRFLILLPNSTTIVETSEVLGVGDNIGGALHSKVGIVAKGIGHIGTMLGPGFCGHLMISLHNITSEIVVLEVGDTFVSLSFDYLHTSVVRTSSTTSGHVDKFSDLGIQIDEQTRKYLTEDWKSNINDIRNKMIKSDAYKEYIDNLKKSRIKELIRIFNKKNISAIVVTIIVFIAIYYGAVFADRSLEKAVWVDRFWNVGCSGIVLMVLMKIFNSVKE